MKKGRTGNACPALLRLLRIAVVANDYPPVPVEQAGILPTGGGITSYPPELDSGFTGFSERSIVSFRVETAEAFPNHGRAGHTARSRIDFRTAVVVSAVNKEASLLHWRIAARPEFTPRKLLPHPSPLPLGEGVS